MTTTLRRLMSSAALAAIFGTSTVAMTLLVAGAANASQIAGMVTVTDDTGAFSVDIPADWVTTTTPAYYDGIDQPFSGDTLLPTIAASPTGEQYTAEGFEVVPSLFVQVYPFAETALDGEFYGDYGVDCTSFDYRDFATNGLTGRWGTTSGCSWAPAQVRASLWAQFDDGSGSVFVDYFSTSGADATWNAVVNSIQVTGPIETSVSTNVFPYQAFGDVVQLGHEPVRGTGCGADGSIGDVVPDGIWAGFIDPPEPGEPLSVDLVCVYLPDAAPGVLAGAANVLIPSGGSEPDLDYLVVNNNERERTIPASPGLELRDAILDENEQCVEGPFLPEIDHSGYQAWINIEGGDATWVIWGCDWLDDGSTPAPGPGAVPTAPPPTAPAPAPNTEDALIRADCALLQHTIWEGDAFLGVEYPADGEPFTDSLRQAIESTRDLFSYEASQVQSELAQGAFAQYYAEWDSLLQAGIYTDTNIGAVTGAGWDALAPLQIACGFPVSTR